MAFRFGCGDLSGGSWSLPQPQICLLKKTEFLQCPVVVAQLLTRSHARFLESSNDKKLGAL